MRKGVVQPFRCLMPSLALLEILDFGSIRTATRNPAAIRFSFKSNGIVIESVPMTSTTFSSGKGVTPRLYYLGTGQ